MRSTLLLISLAKDMYLIHEKSDPLEAFKIFKAEVENKLDKRSRVVRFDRGREFYGRYDDSGRNLGPFAKFLQECGIVHNIACLVLLSKMELLNSET